MRLGTRQECVESSPRVSGVCQDGAMRSRRKFARRSTEGIEKLAGNVKGDRREEDRRTYRKITGGCRTQVELNQLTKELVNVKVKPKFEKWREPLLRKFWRVNRRLSDDWTARATESGRWPAGVGG
ncbi:hypothetical protein BHE74_00020723 [Ensete ventricosum]|nr:hypothetical protein GW17_00010043 [Ensete ventricosum]RWW71530.1 hypothetical protein BHE74_00020723 [Ensete ventricosum]